MVRERKRKRRLPLSVQATSVAKKAWAQTTCGVNANTGSVDDARQMTARSINAMHRRQGTARPAAESRSRNGSSAIAAPMMNRVGAAAAISIMAVSGLIGYVQLR